VGTSDSRAVYVDEDATVDQGASIGAGTRVWGLAQIREGATVGTSCVIGRGVYIGSGVVIGSNCKVQNYALIYEPAALGDGVFIGPGVVLTNDLFPRAVNPDGQLKLASDWAPEGVEIGSGASIGARAVCVAPVRIGEWAMIGAGAVVTSDVKAFSMVRGVPARHVGWVGRSGHSLRLVGETYRCPQTGEEYREEDGHLALVAGGQA
jgi:UDP-2-acetamido-3-amino-2,3-dideoxy-glucuronate N-acetyltransferase